MDQTRLNLLNDVNRAIIKFRGLYSQWSNLHQISYHELLVFYTIREYGFCTQKQICDSYLLPKQTIHNVISALRKKGILTYDPDHSKGREKAFILSAEGEAYGAPVLQVLNQMEGRALDLLGDEKLRQLTDLMLEYDQALSQAMEEVR